MARHLVDTVIFVDLLRGYAPARDWLDAAEHDGLATSAVTAAELYAGCRNQPEQQVVERELASYPIVWISEPISRLAIDWYKQYHLSHGIGFLDCLIGATAYQLDLELCTLNEKHFSPLPGLKHMRPY